MKVGLIGPTNLAKLSTLIGMSMESLTIKAAQIGKIIAESGHELYVNSDGGMLLGVARAYQEHKGARLSMFVPEEPGPWPIGHAKMYAQELGVKIVSVQDWFHANYGVVSSVDICVCAGLSAGVGSELAYIKWDVQFEVGQLRILVAIRELLRKKELPPEFAEDDHVKGSGKIKYIDTVEGLPDVLR